MLLVLYYLLSSLFYGSCWLLFCLFYSLSKCFYGFICFSWPPFLSSVFGKQLLPILPTLPSPLISFVLPMMKLSKSIHYMEYELMIKNLWETWHHYQLPLHYLLLFLCYDALMLQVHDQMMSDMFLRPLLLLLLVFLYIIVL